MHRWLRLLPILGLALSLPMAAPAAATHVGCGSVITADTVLHADIGPCADGGIVVGADNITLDLNGHRIFGLAEVPGDGVGVEVRGRSGVTVTNGTISDFDAGVALVFGGFHTVTGITARDNISALGVGDFGDGIALNGSINNLISNNVVVNNGPFDGIGLFGPANNNTITGNVVRDNRTVSGPTVNQDDGIRLEPGTRSNTVSNNVVERNGLDGIAVFANSTANTISGNTVRDNGFHDRPHRRGDGIRAFQTGGSNTISANSVFANAASGIRIDSMGNSIVSNQTGANDAAADVILRPAELIVVQVNARAVLTIGPTTVDTHVPPRTAAYDLYDTTPSCSTNVWSANTYTTAFPTCTTL